MKRRWYWFTVNAPPVLMNGESYDNETKIKVHLTDAQADLISEIVSATAQAAISKHDFTARSKPFVDLEEI
jgi:hypothetical protein